jgi:hypothetical protein
MPNLHGFTPQAIFNPTKLCDYIAVKGKYHFNALHTFMFNVYSFHFLGLVLRVKSSSISQNKWDIRSFIGQILKRVNLVFSLFYTLRAPLSHFRYALKYPYPAYPPQITSRNPLPTNLFSVSGFTNE